MQCPNCGNDSCSKDGINKSVKGVIKYRFKCKKCDHKFQNVNPVAILPISNIFISNTTTRVAKSKKFVVTSIQPNADINFTFLKALELYCKTNKSELLIVPTTTMSDSPKEIEKYLIFANINLHPKLKLLGNIKLSASAVNPLSGLASMSMGDSIIIGHPQLQMTTLPVQAHDHPVIMTTTGTISDKNYSETKAGYKAEFNHSMSAVVVELDNDLFHIRHLNFDGTGFYDFENYYTKSKVTCDGNSLEAIVTGDEHAIFADEAVKKATYGIGGIISLNPKFIIRHDVLDCYAVSHHHHNDVLTTFKKHTNGMNNMEDELLDTMAYIVETTPTSATNILVASNHVDHLTRWLKECDIRHEPHNAKLYHYLMYHTLCEIEETDSIPNIFELFSEEMFTEEKCKVNFLNRSETFKILDIEVSIHGDKGANGSRGTRPQFAMLPSKTIIGHSHSPGIEKGCYQVGTSSMLNLEYNQGTSSWLNTHCLIYKNGKRQLINIIKGKWRA